MEGSVTPRPIEEAPPQLFLLAIGCLSATALAYEVLLMRLFSIVEWHHFAPMVISLALLGYGASGTFLTLARGLLLPRFETAFLASAALFPISAVFCFFAAQAVPFNALEILWSPKEWGKLIVMYLLLVPPFFFAANCIGLSLQRFGASIGQVYAADLAGAGAGALGIISLLFFVFPLQALAAIATVGLVAPALACLGWKARPRAWLALAGAAAPLLWLALRLGAPKLVPVEFKGLPQALQVIGASLVTERSGPLGLLSVVQSPTVPFRYAPGLSINSAATVPEQLALFTDADGMDVINRFDGQQESLRFLDDAPSALPYHLLKEGASVLVLGSGGGSGVLQAIGHGAATVGAVELNPQTLALVRQDLGDFSGHVYDQPEVQRHIADARAYVASTRERFDLIQLNLLDDPGAGMRSMSESYVYTVEAFGDYLDHLHRGGFIAVTRWVRLPPRDGIKLFATAVTALERSGVSNPGRSLLWIRSWQTATLLVKKGDVTQEEVTILKAFCAQRAFDLAYYPGIQASEANVYNVLREPSFHQAATALLGSGRRSFIDRYKFDVRPATDDRPYFAHFFTWSLLKEALTRRGAGGLSLLDMGYPVQVASLLQAVGISLLLILAPLLAIRSATTSVRPRGKLRIALYFLSLSLGFMFTEMVQIQRFILYLGHPLYAVPVVLAGFLLFAGAGSLSVAKVGRDAAPRIVKRAVLGIAGLSLLYLVLLPHVFDATMGLASLLKVSTVFVLIAPLAFCMGMPFPLGMCRLTGAPLAMLPWAYGINGCASVIAAILAGLLAIHLGHTALVLLGVALYLAAARSTP